ncbi:MAG: FprA family A-type flavoprotein, partial [Bacteroidales bacterium]|nr:FprA family A-type flavoprotein [Bacteroidales bacterium]
MYNKRPIAPNIFHVGVNDRQKEVFENYLPLPRGVAYNAYLIVDEKNALIDTVDIAFTDVFFAKIDAILKGKPVDYLIVNHVEPDHAGAIGLLKQKYPNVQIVGNTKTFDMLNGYFGINTDLHEVKEGDTLSLGKRTLTFYMAPMVHWPEVMVTYENQDKILFSADAFGTFGT